MATAHGGPVRCAHLAPSENGIRCGTGSRRAQFTSAYGKRPADKLRSVNEPARGGVYPTHTHGHI